MAQPMRCDWPGHEGVLADVLLSRLDDGSTMAWCGLHFVDACRSIVAEADAADAEVDLGPTGNPIVDVAVDALIEVAEADAADAEAAARIASVAIPPTSAGSSDAADLQAEPPTNAAGGPESGETGPSASPGPDGALGPNLGPTDDATAQAEPV